MRTLVMVGALVCLAGLVACSVPDVVFTSGDAATDEADFGDDGSAETSPGTEPEQDALAPDAVAPTAVEAGTPPMPGPAGCPAQPPMGAQGCCGTTPCVGPGCVMQCPSCVACTGQVCCTSGNHGGGMGHMHATGMVSCAPDPQSCGGS